MLRKVVLLICDGLGDRPVKELGEKTPLEAAHTPNLDAMAAAAECGYMCALGRGKRPGSDTSHLAILGYDPEQYYPGRGPVETAGIGLELREGDVALRGNFGTVDEHGVIRDRRGGRIRDVRPLTEAIDGLEIGGVRLIVKPGTAHRAGVVMRGPGLSDAITDADPHVEGEPVHKVKPTSGSPEAARTAELLNEFLQKAHKVLRDHPVNADRERRGLMPANFLLVRGAGQYKALPSFQERYGLKAVCIAGGGLYKGIGSLLGMQVLDVPGATGLADTDIDSKFDAAQRVLDEFDFVFVHVKAADSLGEDGNAMGKRDFIDKIDRAARILRALPPDVLVVVTADHTTPCELKAHSADPVPIMFRGEGVRVDQVTEFSERACTRGGLGFITGLDIMPHVQNLLGRLPLIGA
ncbi:MAG: 2,3-bisphosphoglycerate-independent phosphoglycerate mutase [Planctomycetota bacterium]